MFGVLLHGVCNDISLIVISDSESVFYVLLSMMLVCVRSYISKSVLC